MWFLHAPGRPERCRSGATTPWSGNAEIPRRSGARLRASVGFDHAWWGFAHEQRLDVVDDAAEEHVVPLARDEADVRRQDDVVEAEKRMRLGQRLHVVHVEGGAREAALAQGAHERRLVDEWTPRRVDEIRRRL